MDMRDMAAPGIEVWLGGNYFAIAAANIHPSGRTYQGLGQGLCDVEPIGALLCQIATARIAAEHALGWEQPNTPPPRDFAPHPLWQKQHDEDREGAQHDQIQTRGLAVKPRLPDELLVGRQRDRTTGLDRDGFNRVTLVASCPLARKLARDFEIASSSLFNGSSAGTADRFPAR
jgi:hypothetical protein